MLPEVRFSFGDSALEMYFPTIVFTVCRSLVQYGFFLPLRLLPPFLADGLCLRPGGFDFLLRNAVGFFRDLL